MALYDLACGHCGEEFEVFSTGFIKDDQKVCPACGSEQVQQTKPDARQSYARRVSSSVTTSLMRSCQSAESHVPRRWCVS
jgi:putative FmdB family regulatory protein